MPNGSHAGQRRATLAERSYALMLYDSHQRSAYSCQIIAGVDEVGRGCLAGPLVAAAVIFPDRFYIPGLDDSKALSPAQRSAVAARVCRTALCWAVAFVPATYIDTHGLTAANMAAMRQAVTGLRIAPELVLSDGYPISQSPFPNKAVVHGDATSQVIAGASCLAKVVRDSWLAHLGEALYPGYGWERNAGYATREHRQTLAVLGVTPEHRALFLKGCDVWNNTASDPSNLNCLQQLPLLKAD